MKSCEIRRIVDSLARQHFDRAAAFHQHMLGQIHGTHPAFAQQVQQLVFAERKALVLSGQQLFGLPPRDDLAADQGIRNGLRLLDVNSASLVLLQQFLKLITVDQAALSNDLQKRFDGQLEGHA